MNASPTFIPIKPRVPRKGRSMRMAAMPTDLTLIAANYVLGETLTLVFDRPIDIEGINGTKIVVDDGTFTHLTFDGTGAPPILVNPTTVRFTLEHLGTAAGSIATLTATAETGIVAENDGGAWPGATALGLPYP